MTGPAQTTPDRADWLSLFTLGFLWGSSFMAADLALDSFGPVTLAALRLVLGGALLMGIVVVTGRALPLRRELIPYVIGFAACSNALPFFLLNWAQQTVPSSFAGVTQATVPLFVLPLAIAFVPEERFGWLKFTGLLVGFAGVVILIGPGDILSGPAAALPRLACVGAALCYALGGLITRLAPRMDPVGYSATGLCLSAIFTVPTALLTEGIPQMPTAVSTGALFYIALGPTALAAILLVRTVRSAGPIFVTLVNYMTPVWSVLLGLLILGESLPGGFFAAAIVILFGLTLSQWGALRSLAAVFSRR